VQILVLMAQDSYTRFLKEQDAIYSGITDIHV
jgi:hypothetical protein